MTLGRIAGGCAFALLFTACSDPTAPTPPCVAANMTSAVVQLSLYQATRVSERCFKVTGAGANYLVVPQFASEGAKREAVGFSLRGVSQTTASASLSAEPFSFEVERTEPLQRRLDRTLRALEHEMAPEMAASARAGVYRHRSAQLSAQVTRAVPAATRPFQVLGDLDAKTFKTATADLKYEGQNILIYVDKAAPANGFSDQQLNDFGKLFDQTLYTIDVNAFGEPSDIDNDDRVIVLMSPLINALTSKSDCPTLGYVTGYFFGLDLSTTASTAKSNRAEVFYAITPDPSGSVSCSHTVTQVGRTVPGTFIHELQHMISYGQRVLQRGADDEVAWLNEGLSHIAEELGSRYYEARYPAPTGRLVPTALFPDSSLGFIQGNLIDAWRYLDAPTQHSVTTFEAFGTLEERGAAWLFLRWLADQKGEAIFKSLVQSSQSGVANIEGRAGETFPALLGDFGVSVYADSIPGVPRNQIPARYRFATRNLRQLFQYVFQANLVRAAFPITLRAIPVDAAVSGSMPQGTMDFYVLTSTPSAPTLGLQFSRTNNAAFSSGLNAQVALFRLQ